MKALLFLETTATDIKRSSYELLSAAKSAGAETSVILLGSGSKALVGKLDGWNIKKAFVCENEVLNNYNSDLYVNLLADLCKNEKPQLVLASASMLAKDAFPRVAARLGAGFASDAVEINMKASPVTIRKPLFSGKCTAQVSFQNSEMNIILMRANQLPVLAAESGSGAEVVELALPSGATRVKVREVVQGESEKLDLTEANIIVSGGRGMKGAEHFKLLEDLAKPLNATVGASRAVVDSGWVPHSMQVGQTGKTVAPSLYIAAGISGAIQHLAGMSGSKVIVAINKDAEAPIFQKATYGLVGDAFEILPKLTEEFSAISKA